VLFRSANDGFCNFDDIFSPESIENKITPLDLEKYYESAFYCLLLSAFYPVSITSPTQLAKPLYDIAKEFPRIARLLNINSLTAETFEKRVHFMGKYTSDFLKYKIKYPEIKREDYKTMDHYRARYETEVTQFRTFIEHLKGV